MKTIKLVKGLSYINGGFSCKAGSPVVVEDAVADELMRKGCFEIVPDVPAPVPGDEEDEEPEASAPSEGGEPDFSSMTKAELTSYASLHGISLDGCKKVSEMVERIKSATYETDPHVQLGLEV